MARARKDKSKRRYTPDPLLAPPPPALAELLDRHRGQPDALITVLEEIQALHGYLPRTELEYTARQLGFPLAQVYGVATFYNLFRLRPPGRYCMRVCTGTSCYVHRADDMLASLRQRLGIGVGETTADGQFTLETVACVGACGLAPLLTINDVLHGKLTSQTALDLVDQLREKQNSEVPA